MLSGDDLVVKYYGNYSFWPQKYGAEGYFLHRVDLHEGLKKLALTGDSETRPAKINLSSEVVGLDCKTATLRLANGVSYQKDLVVVADGVHVCR